MCFVFISEQTATCAPYNKLIGFYNGDEKFLQRGTEWVLNKAVSASSIKVSDMLFCLTRLCTITRL